MGNTLASGSGISYEVGKNCEKKNVFISNIELTFKDLFTYRIKYNNSKYGKACLAGTQSNNGVILAQNKYFNFQWQFVQNEDTGDSFYLGNHTKKCDKNSLSIVEILRITPTVTKADSEKFKNVVYKFKNNSELDKLIKKFQK